MNTPSVIGLGLLALLGVGAANAGTCSDAWVTKAIQEVTGRAPSGSGNSGDCNIQNYGRGQWSSYADLVGKVRAAKAPSKPSAPAPQAGVCSDAWVTKAVKEVTGRAPSGAGTMGDCNVQKYGNGRWSSYNDLVAKVRTANGMALAVKPSAPNAPAGGTLLGGANGGRVIAPGGGNVIAPGGGNLVSGGAGNLVSGGAGNVIAPGGGNVIAPGGGNLR
ncbi:MAG: hypothetical protein V4731_10725 [Pseudomonadota bacterium]